MTRSGIADQWFIDVIWDTINCWRSHPDSPPARLENGKRWYWYAPIDEEQFSVPFFFPTFKPPYPSCLNTNLQPEMIDQFQKRIRSEFDSQLAEHMKHLRSIFGEDHVEQRQHAQWTALAFTGETFVKIAGKFRHLNQSLEPDAVVKMAARRFAKRIGLTLPRLRRRGR